MSKHHPRVVLLVIDQLAGHWVEGSALVESTGLSTPNVMTYHQNGLIPNISSCINEGLWTLRPLTRGKCMTPYGMRYLATGSYESGDQVILEGDDWRCLPHLDGSFGTLPEWIDSNCPDIKMATFGSFEWLSQGYWHTTQHCVPLPGFYPDDKEIVDDVFPYVKSNPDWDFMMIYLPDHDLTAKAHGIPVFLPHQETPVSDKHHHLINHIDRNIGILVSFLQDKGVWNDTLLIITSDHAYHHGCDAMSYSFRPHNGPSSTSEKCWDHVYPWDCRMWDFTHNQATTTWSDCCRRITQIVTGGALPKRLVGTTRATGDICDAPATVAMALGLPYACKGRSIFSL